MHTSIFSTLHVTWTKRHRLSISSSFIPIIASIKSIIPRDTNNTSTYRGSWVAFSKCWGTTLTLWRNSCDTRWECTWESYINARATQEYYMVWCRGYHQLTRHHAPCSDKCTQSQSWEDKTYRDVEITLTGWYKKWSLRKLTKNWREWHLNPMQLTVQKLNFFGKSWTLWIDCTHLENLTKSGRRSGTVLKIYIRSTVRWLIMIVLYDSHKTQHPYYTKPLVST
jgi:hypothetical protein